MAVDTPTKRSSAVFVRTRCRRFLPVPDGTIAVADRAHLAGVYYEVPAAVVAVYTRIGILRGASKQYGGIEGSSAANGSLRGAVKTNGVLTGLDS